MGVPRRMGRLASDWERGSGRARIGKSLPPTPPKGLEVWRILGFLRDEAAGGSDCIDSDGGGALSEGGMRR